MNIYVAGKFEDRKEIKKIMKRIESKGNKITWDWTDEVPTDKITVMKTHAINDLQGVIDCDTFILIALKDNSYRGSLTELGMALALDKTVWVVGHAVDNDIFINIVNHQFDTLKEMYECV